MRGRSSPTASIILLTVKIRMRSQYRPTDFAQASIDKPAPIWQRGGIEQAEQAAPLHAADGYAPRSAVLCWFDLVSLHAT